MNRKPLAESESAVKNTRKHHHKDCREGHGYVILSTHEMDTKFDEINVI